MSGRYHVWDGGEWLRFDDLEEARKWAVLSVAVAREECDPTWPDYVEEIAVYDFDGQREDAEEFGTLVLRSVECIIEDEEPVEGCDYLADFDILPPAALEVNHG